MGASTQPTDLTDLRTALINAVREATGVTATNTIADRYLNTALHDMVVNWDFPWGVRTTSLITQAPYTTGTITIATGGTTVTGLLSLWNMANDFSVKNARAGGKIILGSESDSIYDVTTVASDVSLTIGAKYIGDDLAADTYVYYEDEYDLASDFFRSVDPHHFARNVPIALIPRKEFRTRYPRNAERGEPRMACIYDAPFSATTARRQRIVFHPAPDAAYKIDYEYITTNLAISSTGVAQTQLTATTDEPIVPLRYRHVLVLHALYNWYRDRKDDTRSQEVKGEYTDLMRRIASDVGVTTPRPRILPRTSQYFPARRRRGSRYSTNSDFDQMRD